MATPLSSLSKRKKIPIGRNVAFRTSEAEFSENDDTTKIQSINAIRLSQSLDFTNLANSENLGMDKKTQISIVKEVRKQMSKAPTNQFSSQIMNDRRKSITSLPIIADNELIASLSKKLRTTEQKLVLANQELRNKSERLKEIEARIAFLEMSSEKFIKPGRMVELEKKCSHLQKQNQDMEEFLNDYGLIWVGKDEEIETPQAIFSDQEQGVEGHEGNTSANQIRSNLSTQMSSSVWVPESATPARLTPTVDFKLLFANLKLLNAIMSENTQVVRTNGGATFKRPDMIPLSVYKNGIILFEGPFRSYTDPVTFQVVQDILDGYFPQELKNMFVEGIPFEVYDKRDLDFEEPRLKIRFPGTGRSLYDGKEVEPSVSRTLACLYDDTTTPNLGTFAKRKSNERPFAPIPIEKFLNKLPTAIIKNDKTINIRSEIEAKLKGNQTPVKMININTNIANTNTILKIKSIDGNEVFILKMKSNNTINDVITLLQDMTNNHHLVLKTNYPIRILSNFNQTLEECNLTPTATLYMSIKSP